MAGSGHTRQLLRQSDPVLLPNNGRLPHYTVKYGAKPSFLTSGGENFSYLQNSNTHGALTLVAMNFYGILAKYTL